MGAKTVGGFVLAAALSAGAHDADACTPPWEGVGSRTTLPEDGATDVPRNARLLITYDSGGDSDPGNTLELRVLGGASVATVTASVTTIGFGKLVIPTTTLEPATTYELLDSLVLPCDFEDASLCLGEPQVISTFTTGTELDVTPPSLSGIGLDSDQTCPHGSCEEGEIAAVDFISVATATDDHPTAWVRYEYLSLSGDVLAGPTHALTIGRNCDLYIPFYVYLALPPQVRLRAIDLAGNVEVTSHEIDGLTCEEVDPCADPFDDAGIPDGAPGPQAEDADAGCCSASGRSTSGMLAVIGLLALRPRRYARGR